MKTSPPKAGAGVLAVRTNASLWLCLVIVVLAATMMHPTGASLLSILLIGVLLAAVRWTARREGEARATQCGTPAP